MWLHLPRTSACFPASEVSTSDLELLSARLAASVTVNGKLRQSSAWLRELKKGHWTLRLSGRTSELLTYGDFLAYTGSELLADFRAKISASPEAGPGSTPGPALVSGGNTYASSETAGPAGHSLKTYPDYSAAPALMTWNPESQQMEGQQTGLFETSTPYLGRFPNSGSMRNGALFPRQTWEPVTAESESSSWRTPDTPGSGGPRNRQDSRGNGHQITIGEQAEAWATPDGSLPGGYNKSPTAGAANRPTISTQSENWGTPRATTGQYCNQRDGGTIQTVQGQAEDWQEPGSESSPPAPQTQSGKTCWCNDPGCDLRSHKRRLNPLFVTWLMGWPIWWLTSVQQPSAGPAMVLYLSRQRLLLRSLLGGRACLDSEVWPTPRVDAGPYSQHGAGTKKYQTSLEYVSRDWDGPK